MWLGDVVTEILSKWKSIDEFLNLLQVVTAERCYYVYSVDESIVSYFLHGFLPHHWLHMVCLFI